MSSLDPLAEFHAEAIKLFASLLEQVEEQSAETFDTAPITDAGVDLDAAGVRRPSATWTYLVRDKPFDISLKRGPGPVRRPHLPSIMARR